MWRLLCVLDECMQQYHSAIFNDEQDTTDPSFRDLTANLPNTAAQCATQRHPNGPAKLKKLYILSNDLPVRATEILEPFTDRLTPGWQFIESSWNSLHVLSPYISYQNWYQRASRKVRQPAACAASLNEVQSCEA